MLKITEYKNGTVLYYKSKTTCGEFAKQRFIILNDLKNVVIIVKLVLSDIKPELLPDYTVLRTFKDKHLYRQIMSFKIETIGLLSDFVKNYGEAI